MRAALPFLVLGAFLLLFHIRARREGKTAQQWLRDRNRATFSRPGWWRLPAAWTGVVLVVFFVFATVVDGFRWLLLALCVGFGVVAVVSMALVGWWARRFL